MTAFNFFSHGSQDAYPNLFLKGEHPFDTQSASLVTAIANVGAICGGIFFGSMSEKIGRRRAMLMAALLALPALPFWAFGSTPAILAAGAFVMYVVIALLLMFGPERRGIPMSAAHARALTAGGESGMPEERKASRN